MRSSRLHGAPRAGLRALMLLAALLAAGTAQALSLGNASLQSRVGEPLRVSIPLGNLGTVTQGEIIVGHAPQADYARFGIDRAALSTPLRFELLVDKSGNASVEVRSETPISEPFIDVVVEVRWPTGRLVREYTLLLDLPPR
jgi:pilus assembly protein FimV